MGSKIHINKNPYASMAPGADREFFEKHNPYGITVSQMRHNMRDSLAEGRTLEQLMAWKNSPFNTHVKPSTKYKYLINDTGEDIPGLRTYESLGMENRPLADQFGGDYDLEKIKGQIAELYPDNPLYSNEAKAKAEAKLAAEKAAAEAANQPKYLTADDLTAWWDSIDKSSWTKQENSKPKPMDDFMKMMMFMSVLNPRRSSNINQLGSMFGQFY